MTVREPVGWAADASTTPPSRAVEHQGRRRARLRASLLLEVASSSGSAGALVAGVGGAAGTVPRRVAMAALRSLERDGLVVAFGDRGSERRYRLSGSGEERLCRFGASPSWRTSTSSHHRCSVAGDSRSNGLDATGRDE